MTRVDPYRTLEAGGAEVREGEDAEGRRVVDLTRRLDRARVAGGISLLALGVSASVLIYSDPCHSTTSAGIFLGALGTAAVSAATSLCAIGY